MVVFAGRAGGQLTSDAIKFDIITPGGVGPVAGIGWHKAHGIGAIAPIKAADGNLAATGNMNKVSFQIHVGIGIAFVGSGQAKLEHRILFGAQRCCHD